MALPDQVERKRKVSRIVGGKVLWSLERLIRNASTVDTTPFLDPELFPWTGELEENTATIRGELEQILTRPEEIPSFQEISHDQVSITQDDRWKTFFLYGMGYKAEKNCARCPETTRLVEQVPGMTTAFFSILSPGKHIPAHRGLYCGFLRYHLGLIVPDPPEACRIRVHDQFAHWEMGKSMLFDDTYDHEVWNDTDGLRAVLFLDVVRPLRFPVSALNRTIIQLVRRSGYVQDAKRNQDAWERRLALPT
jgi:ornithine lipid ester-linked acyl 2-hydroxylase